MTSKLKKQKIMEKYSESFKRAVKFTHSLRLNQGESFGRFDQDYSFVKLCATGVQRFKQRGWDTLDLSDNCGEVHADIYHLLERANAPVYLTIGNVYIENESWFNTCNTESLRAELMRGAGDGNVNFHVWLTLPDMSIIDFTIKPSQLKKNGSDTLLSKSITYVAPDQFKPDHYYEPVLVGNEFLIKTGVYGLVPVSA